jgi:hypothetical protein
MGVEAEVLQGVGHVPAEEIPAEIAELVVRVANELKGPKSKGHKSVL